MTGWCLKEAEAARALAYGLLAADDWSQQALEASARQVLGRWHSWLRPLVGQVRDTYQVPPADRPLELARTIARSEPFARGVEEAGPGAGLVVAELLVEPTGMGERRWPVPIVDDVDALARRLRVLPDHLSWLADLQGRTPAGPEQVYRYQWLARSGRAPRLLEAPTPILRGTLRRLLSEVIERVPIHPAAHGFVRGRSAITHAAGHVGCDVVITLDLRHFFTAVTAGRVYGIFRTMGYPEPVAHVLAGLVTNRVPPWVLRQMPPGGDSSARHRLRAWLRTPHLPQGAPTSPSLANLVCFTLDARLAGYAASLGARYSRYADDLTFSGPVGLRERSAALVQAVTTITTEEGFVVHRGKTRVQPSSGRQLVTGIVVNTQLGLPRAEVDRLRAVLHEARTRGVLTANRLGHPDFRAHLTGRVSWVESVNPDRGRRLRAELDTIAWPES